VDDGPTVGRVEQIWLYPVRSLAGTRVSTAEVDAAGLTGDRALTVVDDDGRVIRAKDAPLLGELAGTEADAAALSAAVGRAVRLAAVPPGPGVAPVHLASRQAIDRAALGDVPQGCSADDPRANLLLDLPEEDERGWVGRTVRIGEVELHVTRTPKHCLGVYADVRRPGRIRVGDRVEVAPR
jgi:MOSC domain-containing protein YiiM